MPNSSPPLRHLPTLTEVVPPTAVAAPLPAVRPPLSPSHVSVDEVMQQMAPVLEAELRKSASALLEAHVEAVLPQALQALRGTLEKTLAQGRPPP